MNLEAEQLVLGTLLSHNEAIYQLSELKPEHFQTPLHADMYSVASELIASGKPANIITVKAGIQYEVEASYLVDLMKAGSTVAGVSHIAGLIIEESNKKRLISACENVIKSSNSAADIASQLANAISDATASTTTALHSDKFVAEQILKEIDAPVFPFSTGLQRLDDAMGGGMYPKKAYGIAARKKVGKTIALSTISYNLNENGVKHLFICGEMGEREIHERCMARKAEMYPSAFRVGNKRPSDFNQRIMDAAVNTKGNTLYYDAPNMTLDSLKSIIAVSVAKHKIKGFILDYWQLVGGKKGSESEAYHLGEVAQWIASACKMYNIFALVAAQINQEGNTRGGEGMRLAFDQVYHLQPINDDITSPERWLEMMDTRYTAWYSIGDNQTAGLVLNEKGPYFEEVLQGTKYSYGN